ncbi:MAG: hypothetical protein ACUVXI_08605 [bacterium]
MAEMFEEDIKMVEDLILTCKQVIMEEQDRRTSTLKTLAMLKECYGRIEPDRYLIKHNSSPSPNVKALSTIRDNALADSVRICEKEVEVVEERIRRYEGELVRLQNLKTIVRDNGMTDGLRVELKEIAKRVPKTHQQLLEEEYESVVEEISRRRERISALTKKAEELKTQIHLFKNHLNEMEETLKRYPIPEDKGEIYQATLASIEKHTALGAVRTYEEELKEVESLLESNLKDISTLKKRVFGLQETVKGLISMREQSLKTLEGMRDVEEEFKQDINRSVATIEANLLAYKQKLAELSRTLDEKTNIASKLEQEKTHLQNLIKNQLLQASGQQTLELQ